MIKKGNLKYFSFLLFIFSLTTMLSAREIERYALIVGANNGGRQRVTLRYAQSDARSVAKVFTDLGGVDEDKLSYLEEPSSAELLKAFDLLQARIQIESTPGSRSEFIFYYSGHSDENGLLLGEELLSFDILSLKIKELSADVKVAVLDSCSSGAIYRYKGGVKRQPFLVDTATDVSGHAFLTSAASDEAAQESDYIGASFFTYYFVTGLRGAADVTRDGKVTLNEVYQFTFHETLSRTEKSLGGSQHPGFDMQLSGAGDFVLTDLRSTTSQMIIDESIYGKIYIRKSDIHVSELHKAQGNKITLSLPPGDYSVTLDQDKLYEASCSLKYNEKTKLGFSSFKEISREQTVLRGGTQTDEKTLPTIGVLAFEANNINDIDAKILQDAFTNDLVATKAYRVVERSNIDSLLSEQRFVFSGSTESDYALEVGRFLNMNHMILGSVSRLESKYIIIIRMVNVESGEIEYSVMENGPNLQDLLTKTNYLALKIANKDAIIARETFSSVQSDLPTEDINSIQSPEESISTMPEEQPPSFTESNQYSGNLNSPKFPIQFSFVGPAMQIVPTDYTITGFSLGIIRNVNENVIGGNVSVIISDVRGRMVGTQIGLICNADTLVGTQFGLINRTRVTNISQVGLVNMTSQTAKGVQIGLVNIAGTLKGVQIGLVNINKARKGSGFMPLINIGF